MLNIVLGLVFIVLAIHQPAASQVVIGNDMEELILGSAQVDKYTVKFQIAYGGDAAFLVFCVTDGKSPPKYAPLFASTYRGVPSVNLDIYASKSGDEIWVQSSWPGSEVIAYHRLGTNTAITQFGEMELLDSPVPQALSGGPIPFPELDQNSALKKASFYHHEIK